MYKNSYLYSDQDELRVVSKTTLLEKALLDKLKDGDVSAFSTIFSAYYSDLVAFAVRLTHELNLAEEIVQDTFVRLWEEHANLGIHTSLKSYLLKSVQNRCIDLHRHRKIQQIHASITCETSSSFDYDTDHYIFRSELEQHIESALALIPTETANVFRMNRFEGLKYHEIAEKLKVSVRTVEVRMSKVLKLLQEQLKEFHTV